MRSISVLSCLAGMCLVHSTMAIEPNQAIPKSNVASNPDVQMTQAQHSLNAAFIKRQMENNASIGRAIKSIGSHYPQEITNIVNVALDTYPDKYKEIIYAAISTQPMATEEIVRIAIEKNITECESIVEMAIIAEPSYVDFVVSSAANTTPEELQDIVRVAVMTEPDSADRIVQTLSQEHPNEMVEIMKTAIGAVPFVGEYIVDGLLALFPDEAEAVVENAVRESSSQREQIVRIIETAEDRGVNAQQLKVSALKGGATEEEIARATDRPR